MKFCSKCGTQCEDNAAVCSNCGEAFAGAAVADVTDHTAEFDAKDISDNKVIAMVIYLLGPVRCFPRSHSSQVYSC